MGRTSRGHLHIGTSGWLYKSWWGPFYPEETKQEDLLPFFARHFDTVELNTSFYHTPKPTSVERWRKITPASFRFAVKCSRWITHRKYLDGTREDFQFFFDILPGFGKKLGPILYQTPPRFNKNVERLEHFLKLLPSPYRAVFEFRNDSWFCEEVYECLHHHNAALCLYDFNRFQSPEIITADFIYVRLHGPDGRYKGSYPKATLSRWARQIRDWQNQGLDLYCYFDNDEKGYAVKDALRLKSIIDERA